MNAGGKDMDEPNISGVVIYLNECSCPVSRIQSDETLCGFSPARSVRLPASSIEGRS